uniref:Uncharacterized protein n=1 Tax=Fagus sylvatica TaxID=28930 RepID=A0A2N9IWY8_FAGSY
MGLASVIHPGMPRVSLPPKWTRLQLIHHQIITISTVAHNNRRAEFYPIACSRGTEQEDHLSTSESKGISSQSYDDIVNTETSDTPPSVSHVEKTQGHEYVSSVRTVALWVCTAVAFGIGLGLKDGVGKATEFFAGAALCSSKLLGINFKCEVVFRLTIILLGAATLQRFEAVNLLLAAILLFSSFKLFTSEEDDSDLSNNFVVKTCQRVIPVTCVTHFGQATPLLLTVAVIELSDIAFAVDSIPAVFGVTRDPVIVFTSNLFAILGLRSLYTLISEGMSDLEYLQSLFQEAVAQGRNTGEATINVAFP